ncbi:MAG TPA: hypothetical protein VK050_08510 [Flavobacteriaceae bacterium]|nr:hypothetical protein [Flavobacteriaceae bacterium]
MNEEIFTYYQNTLCVYGAMLYEEGVTTIHTYRNMVRRGHLILVQKGGNGRRALVEYDSMRNDIKKKVAKRFGDPYATQEIKLVDYIKPDPVAATFYAGFRKQDGNTLDADTQLIYRTHAEIFNAITELMDFFRMKVNSRGNKRRFTLGEFFRKVSKAVNNLPETYKHSLGVHPRTLQRNYRKYIDDGYVGIIHGGFGNNNSRVVNDAIEKLIVSIYCQNNNPYSSWVHEDYTRFVTGQIEIVDVTTGELFERSKFLDKNGKPILISEPTVWNYLNAPHNQPIIAKYRRGALEFQSLIRPHTHRHAPTYSLSKVSMDDRDLQRKMHNGKRVKVYYAYDVMSGIIIGSSYSRNKDTSLFIDCMRDMFQNIDAYGLGTPLEVEVEHHLVNNFKDDLMKAGNVFPFVRWANPGNAQEKWAETGNRLKKYGYEKRYQDGGIGRFFAKLEANRTYQDKVFDEHNNTYKYKTYDYERLVADDQYTIELYNNSPHPEFEGMTRLEVFKAHANPNLAELDKALLAKYIGVKVETSIRRNQYVRVNYQNYQISLSALRNLKPNNKKVEAYYLPHESDTVYLYQDNNFICKADYIVEFSTARAEWDEQDEAAYTNQMKHIKEFDSMVKNGSERVARIEIIENNAFDLTEEVQIVPPTQEDEDYDEFAELLSDYDPSEIARQAIESL